MTVIFLHGGGDDPAGRESAFGPFIAAMPEHKAGSLVLVIATGEADEQKENVAYYSEIFVSLRMHPAGIQPLLVTPDHPLTEKKLAELNPVGVFICGGQTPYYYDALCRNQSWVPYIRKEDIPYCGTSAGAAIAGREAIIGGWQAERNGKTRQILFSGAGEGLGMLTVNPGLGLVPFAVDVHASQWGTLTRLIHAVDLGFVAEGWAIDENTTLEWREDTVQVHGLGQAYYVRPGARGVEITVHTP